MDVFKLIPALAFIVTLMQFARSVLQARKRISHQLVSSRRILSVQEQGQFDLILLCGNAPVSDVFRVVIEVRNSGRLPIEPTDYQLPLTIKAKNGANIISAVVEDTNPPALRELMGKLNPTEGRVELPNILLNKGNSVFIKLLIQSFEGVELFGHAKDTDIRQVDSEKSMTWTLLIAGPVMVLSGAVWLSLSQSKSTIEAISFPMVSVSLGILFFFMGMFLRTFTSFFRYTSKDVG